MFISDKYLLKFFFLHLINYKKYKLKTFLEKIRQFFYSLNLLYNLTINNDTFFNDNLIIINKY